MLAGFFFFPFLFHLSLNLPDPLWKCIRHLCFTNPGASQSSQEDSQGEPSYAQRLGQR